MLNFLINQICEKELSMSTINQIIEFGINYNSMEINALLWNGTHPPHPFVNGLQLSRSCMYLGIQEVKGRG